MTDPKSILIVRLSAIGDVIHALPVLDALKRNYPEARLGWIVEELSAPLLENHPQLDQVYVIPKKRWKKNFRSLYFSEIRPYFKQVKRDGWDVAIDLQGLTKSGLVAKASGAKIRIGYGDKDGREINKLFTNKKVTPRKEAVHVVQRNLELLRGLDIEPDPQAVGKLGFLDEEIDAIKDKLKDSGWDGSTALAALNPGAGWSSKKWPVPHFVEVGKRLFAEYGYHPLILWGPGEEDLRDGIAEQLCADSVPFVIAPKTSVRELAVLISVSAFFVGGDTGPTHMAGMLGVPTVSIFGASDGHRNRPWPISSSTLVQLEELDCVPCWKTVCPLSENENLKCLKTLSPDRVMQAVQEQLNQHNSAPNVNEG